MRLFWYLIPNDGPFPWRPEGTRQVDFGYLKQLAGTIEQLGFEGALVAGGGAGHDLWVLSSFLASETQRMKFIIAQHPGQTSPLLMAQKTATFQELSAGRLIINVVNGADTVGPPHGVFLKQAERYAMAEEYWSLWSRLIEGERITSEGRFFRLEDAALQVKARRPELHFGGSSPAAIQVASRLADTYLTYGEAPPVAAEKIRTVDSMAREHRRKLGFGIRLHVIVRETREEAWAAAEWLYRRMDPESIRKVRSLTEISGSLSQERMNELNAGPLPRTARELEIYPDLWAGVGLIRAGNAVAIVGDAETVAARLSEYEALGFGTFILSAFPLIEEAYRFADLVLPLLGPSRTAPSPVTRPSPAQL